MVGPLKRTKDMKEIKRVLEKVCPCCGGAGYYSETGTETVRGEDGCPEPSPCEVQVQCDCNGIKEAEIKKIMLRWVGSDKEIKPNDDSFDDRFDSGYNYRGAEIRKSIRKGESV